MTSFRYGRRPPKRHPAVRFDRMFTGVVPDHPAMADYLAALNGGWQMLGNDAAGDCVSVTWANTRRLVTATLGKGEVYPSQDQVWALYKTQNPGFDPAGDPNVSGPGSQADGGMDIQTTLEYLVSTGGPDGVKALGFASVDHTSPDECRAAIAVGGSLWTGVNCQAANQAEFQAGQPWDWDPAAVVEGGHSVVTGGYAPPGDPSGPVVPLGGDERFITWAQETSFTDTFWQYGTEEAWLVIWPEHLGSKEFLMGVDLSVFAGDYQAITGKPFPYAAAYHMP